LCPIIDIVLVGIIEAVDLEDMGYTVHYDSDFLPGKYLAYSKHNLRQYYNKKFGAPLIKAGFSYGGNPCYGFNRDLMIFYKFE